MLLSTLLAALLAACGSDGTSETSAVSVTASATDGGDSADSALKTIQAAAAGGDVARQASNALAGDSSVSTAVGAARALTGTAAVSIAGLADTTTAVNTKLLSLRTFHIDSVNGNDGNNGLAATAAGAGVGPWRTLARLQRTVLQPGDAVQLACESRWRETLKINTDGSETLPIRIYAASGCTNLPVIDGSLDMPAITWRLKTATVYQATMPLTPVGLFGNDATKPLTEAHHPNRGYLASDPNSSYLSALQGNTVTVNGRTGSNQFATGTDLVLPAGVNLAGARVRVRTAPYVIDEAVVSAASGGRLSLDRLTTFPVQTGMGYLLMGQYWMLDSPGEWHYDSGTGTISVWMPDSAAPGARLSVGLVGTGVDLVSRRHIVLDGFTVRRVARGVDARKTVGVQLRNMQIEDIIDTGVHGGGSDGMVVEASTVQRTGHNAIDGQGDPIANATRFTVRNNIVRNSGATLQGELLMSVPRRSIAAILGADGSTVSGNTVVNTGYIGILVGKGSKVLNNFVFGTCSVQDDCGAIYAGGMAAQTEISGNTVIRSRGMRSGLTPGSSTAAQGIYVDNTSSGFTVTDNTVADADVGIQLHDVSDSVVRGNRLYGNRLSQLWLQEDSGGVRASGDVFGNRIEANHFAPVTATAYGSLLTSNRSNTGAFATYSTNRYYDLVAGTVTQASGSNLTRALTLRQWLGSTGVGSNQTVDPDGSGASLRSLSGYTPDGGNLVSNANLASGLTGWGGWNASAPAGQMLREACTAGTCLRYVAGGSAGILSSPKFALSAGRWYRLTVDVLAETDNQTVPLVVRAGGGDYAWVSDRSLIFTSGRSWTRRSVVFQATRSLDPNDASLGRIGARVDFDGIEPGRSLSIANLEVVPVSATNASQTSHAAVNAGSQTLSVACPWTATQPALCASTYRMADDQPMSWPISVAARSAVVVYATSSTWVDSDGDGIPDSADRCPATSAGAAVNAAGCSFAQR